MNDEFNRREWKNPLPEERENYREYTPCGENPAARETPALENGEFPSGGGKKKPGNASGGTTKLFSLLTTAVAAVTVVTVIAPAVIEKDNTVVNFAELYATDTSVSYFISVENPPEAPLRVVVYNDFTRRETPIEGEAAAGEETGLKPNMYYKIAVMKGNKILAETKLRTKTAEEEPPPGPITVFNSVTYEYTYATDGKFRFKMDFIDENGYWRYFQASLISSDQTGGGECAFTENPHEEQVIELYGSAIQGNAIFTITCVSFEPDENGLVPVEGNVIVLYEETIQL